MNIAKVNELSFDSIVKMKVTDVILYCGYSIENPAKFTLDFRKKYGFSFSEYKRKMIHDYIKQNHHRMTTKQLAKNCNLSIPSIQIIKKQYGLNTVQKAKSISELLDLSNEDIKQTITDIYPAQFIKIKIKQKVKTGKLKIKMKRLARYWKFSILCGRKKIAEGEYHKEFAYNAIKEIQETYLGIVK